MRPLMASLLWASRVRGQAGIPWGAGRQPDTQESGRQPGASGKPTPYFSSPFGKYMACGSAPPDHRAEQGWGTGCGQRGEERPRRAQAGEEPREEGSVGSGLLEVATKDRSSAMRRASLRRHSQAARWIAVSGALPAWIPSGISWTRVGELSVQYLLSLLRGVRGGSEQSHRRAVPMRLRRATRSHGERPVAVRRRERRWCTAAARRRTSWRAPQALRRGSVLLIPETGWHDEDAAVRADGVVREAGEPEEVVAVIGYEAPAFRRRPAKLLLVQESPGMALVGAHHVEAPRPPGDSDVGAQVLVQGVRHPRGGTKAGHSWARRSGVHASCAAMRRPMSSG